MLQTVRMEKVDEKNGVISPVSMFPSWVMVFKWIYIYASKKFYFTLSENGSVYYALTYYFGLGFEVEEFC